MKHSSPPRNSTAGTAADGWRCYSAESEACLSQVLLDAIVSGHLFVLRGDLALLRCDAILVPCDSDLNVVWHSWSRILPHNQFEQSPFDPAWRRFTGVTDNEHFADVITRGERWVRLVVTAGYGRRGNSEQVARRVVQTVKEAITDLADRRHGNSRSGRVKPLIALPLVGTGAMGSKEPGVC